MLQHTGRLWSRISYQITMWQRWNFPPYSPDLVLSSFFPVPSNEISTQGRALLCCYWHHEECDGKAEKTYTTWLSGIFTTPSQSLAEFYSCKRGLFWRICSLNDCTVLYFSEIKWFREHFEATTYILHRDVHIQIYS